jgi:hypothetical protein
MLPSRGCCHAVFLLVYSAKLKKYSDLEDWISATKSRATIMAAALNLSTVAGSLVSLNLTALNPVLPIESLRTAGNEASVQTFENIARVLLESSPPVWLKVAVSEVGVSREYIPAADLEALSWLGGALDTILLDVFRSLNIDDDLFAKSVGDAGELVIVEALRQIGGNVVHVSRVSDSYGYDIEHHHAGRVARIEVKACSSLTADRFILSRNEFDKSQALKSEWTLLQVVFEAGAVFGAFVSSDDVVQIRELSAEVILRLSTPDSQSFRWKGSAEFRPAPEDWKICKLRLPRSCRVPLRPELAHFLK